MPPRRGVVARCPGGAVLGVPADRDGPPAGRRQHDRDPELAAGAVALAGEAEERGGRRRRVVVDDVHHAEPVEPPERGTDRVVEADDGVLVELVEPVAPHLHLDARLRLSGCEGDGAGGGDHVGVAGVAGEVEGLPLDGHWLRRRRTTAAAGRRPSCDRRSPP